MLSPVWDGRTPEEFNYVIKHTFIEVKSLDNESKDIRRVHRRISEPTRVSREVNYVPEPLPKFVDSPHTTDSLPTPSTCLSVNGDDFDGEGSRLQERRYSFAGSVDSDSEVFIAASSCQSSAVQNFGFCFEQAYPSEHIGAACDLHGLWSYTHEGPHATISQTCYPANFGNGTCEVFSTVSPLQPMPSTDVAWQDSAGGEFPCAEDVDETKTTVMVRNLQSSVTQGMFVQQVCDYGFLGLFDFVYMPMNFRAQGNFGYAFVNFISVEVALRFMAHLRALETDEQQWRSVWSTCQGLDANIERYRNSPLMHELIPLDCKPSIYDENGNQVAFPAPTKPFKKPRIHFAKHNSSEGEESPGRSEAAREVEKIAVRECRPGRSKKQQQSQATPAYWSSGGSTLVTEAVLQQHTFRNSGFLNQQSRASPR
jgi:hypothetical protein